MTSNIDNVLIDDIENNLLFFKNGKIANRGIYINDNHLDYFGEYKKTIKDTIDIVEYKGRNKLGFIINNKAYFTKDGFLKLGLMDKHISDKKVFEDKLIKHLNLNNKKCIIITLNNGQYDLDIFFLKYISKEVLSSIYWYINRNKPLNIVITLLDNEIIYHATNYYNIDDCIVLYYIIGDFLKAYETMGLELAPAIEETKPYIHPKAFKRTDKIEPFRRPTGGARCTMTKIDGGLLEQIKNLDAEELYPKTITIGNLSIHDDKIIEAYNQFLTMIFDKEKYDGVSIRMPKEYDNDWYKILPCFKSILDLSTTISKELDLYLSIKKIGNNGNYIYDTDSTDYIPNVKGLFSYYDKILNVNISDLQTRLIDIIMDDKEDSKSPIVGQGDEVKLGNKISSELKDTGSRTQIRYDNDGTSGATLMRCYNNLLRGLPFDHIDNFDFEGDNIEMLFSQSSINKRLPDPNKIDNTGYTIRKVYPTQSTFKRLSESDILDKLTVNDIVDNSELNMLKDVYDKHIGIVSIRCKKDTDYLDINYRAIFKKHIDKGVLYPKLRFEYEYGYTINENSIIEYNITRTKIVPFKSMISTKPMNIHNDIMERYSVLIQTQSSMSSIPVGSNVIDSNQVDSCIEIYRSMFSRYIELGILKNTLIFDVVKNSHKFPAIWEIYNDSYIYQDKPIRLYNIYLNVISAFSDSINLKYAKTTICSIYKSIFKRYIDVGLMKSELEYTAGLPFPTIDKLWLCR